MKTSRTRRPPVWSGARRWSRRPSRPTQPPSAGGRMLLAQTAGASPLHGRARKGQAVFPLPAEAKKTAQRLCWAWGTVPPASATDGARLPASRPRHVLTKTN